MGEDNKPFADSRKGTISIAIFDGRFGKTAVVQKSYKKDDKWVRSQINLFLNELPNLKEAVDEITTKCKKEIEESMKKKTN